MDITLIGGTSAVVIIGILIYVIKTTKIPTQWLPLLSLVVGIIVVCLGTWSFTVASVLNGIFLGALTSGIYDNLDKGKEIATGILGSGK